MSRSYRKHYSDYHNRGNEYEPPYWGCIRVKERKCVQEETLSFENGHTVFPDYYWDDGNFAGRACYSKKAVKCDIRTGYFAEIQSILNDYSMTIAFRYQSSKEEFLRCFRKIRGEIEDNNPLLSFAWLNLKAAKNMIKAWKGAPLDVLYELTGKGIVEKAVRLGCKKRLRK